MGDPVGLCIQLPVTDALTRRLANERQFVRVLAG